MAISSILLSKCWQYGKTVGQRWSSPNINLCFRCHGITARSDMYLGQLTNSVRWAAFLFSEAHLNSICANGPLAYSRNDKSMKKTPDIVGLQFPSSPSNGYTGGTISTQHHLRARGSPPPAWSWFVTSRRPVIQWHILYMQMVLDSIPDFIRMVW